MQWVKLAPEEHNLKVNLRDGGGVVVADHATSPVELRVGPDTAYFGPLGLRVSSKSLWLERFEYLRRPSSPISRGFGKLPFTTTVAAAGGGVAAVEQREAREDADRAEFSRREVLAGTVTALGALAVTPAEAAAATQPTLTVAEMDIQTNQRGVELVLTDEIAEVLPSDRTYTVLNEGTEVDTLSPQRPTAVVPAGRTGTVSVLTAADIGTIHTLRKLSDFGTEPVEFTADLPQPASAYADGETVTVTSDPALVRPVSRAENVVVTLGGESVPSRAEGATDVGAWHIDNGRLRYTAGSGPPEAVTVTIAAGVSGIQEAMDDTKRVF